MSDEIIIEELPGKNGLVGRITLNRPQALNALTENMCAQILGALEKWENDPTIKLVLIKGAGEKAFCAGGDIRQVYVHGKDKMKMDSPVKPENDGAKSGNIPHSKDNSPANSRIDVQPFFFVEYAMNKALHHFKKPYFSLLNGITMGGGVGASIHGSHRIATEKLRLAMPETAIGFYPDVGAGYHLVRCPKKFGWYLALTGNPIGPAEALYSGLCTHYINSNEILNLENALLASADENVLHDFTEDGFPSFTEKENSDVMALFEENSEIENIFTANNLDEVIEKLEKSSSSFAKNTLEILSLRSPTSLKVTWEHLKHCEKLSFDEVMQENYVMTMHFLKAHDFFEGVRAQIIDKDKNPKWMPSKLSEVTPSQILGYFK